MATEMGGKLGGGGGEKSVPLYLQQSDFSLRSPMNCAAIVTILHFHYTVLQSKALK